MIGLNEVDLTFSSFLFMFICDDCSLSELINLKTLKPKKWKTKYRTETYEEIVTQKVEKSYVNGGKESEGT